MSVFNKVKIRKPKRSTFDLSHEVKTTCEFGNLVPILCQEVVPGDTFSTNSQIFARVAPMVAPIMSRVNIYTHFFFVPNRIIWDEWEQFITGGQLGDDFPEKPYVTLGDATHYLSGDTHNDSRDFNGTLADYMGLPFTDNSAANDIKVDLLPFFAYQKIYNDWYRDPNVGHEVHIPTGATGYQDRESQFIQDIFKLRNRCWKKDYFTGALPFPQRGEDVHLPFEGNIAPLQTDGQLYDKNGNLIRRIANGDYVMAGEHGEAPETNAPTLIVNTEDNGYVMPTFKTKWQHLDLSGISPTIIETRRAFKVQEWLEKNSIGGHRYIEQILAHFGVRSSDSRLQRPELLGGGKSPILVSEVLQTSSTDDVSPQGNMAGHGVSAQATHRFKRHFEEHGFVIGIMSIMPVTSYMQGLDRKFSRFDKFDYLWPEFATIGEQDVKNQEVCVDFGTKSQLEDTFGYVPRYSEYKFQNNKFSGDFKNTMMAWHLGRKFANRPLLNHDFMTCKAGEGYQGLNRIFAYTGGHHFWVQIFHNIAAKRPLPYYGESHF